MGLFSILGGTFGGGRANGGSVTGGTPYEVGERGSELFVPGVSGTIMPADAFAATKEALSAGTASGDAFDESAEAMNVSRAFAQNTSSIASTTNYMSGQSESSAQEAALTAMSNDPIRVEVDTVNVGGLDAVSYTHLTLPTNREV